ncbi:hypothetical protein [Xenorhabdus hominickii]|uniref:Uncharacterized protein n=1 Tax=Xenorhabdus hominickii TaxID=351679 RepID=A0A1V0M4L3_XENHO|nr:hypothetical protein [Xenorhabdus hominickii]ARD69812.1 hypothetical protein [Xenorhabdus hominickii]PHM51912.1 hypothetical protein Xhom_04751 [Xenorhabdus hominickii]
MIKDWLKHRLTPEKQKSTLWCEFTDSLQAVLEETVEPLLERISHRKSIFTMHPEDLDKRIAELGKFFIIRTEREKSKPVLLSQRLDEIHFKGTERPISATFWREFNNLPAKWSPLWAPVDQAHFPYGTVFLPHELVETAKSRYGEFFLTSRGVIQLSLNTLYEKYGYKEQAKLFSRLTKQFDQVIAPLIPLEIVYNGFHFFFYFTITEEAELLILKQTRLFIDAQFKLQDVENTLSGATRQLTLPNQVIRAIIRPLKQHTYRFDDMPLDAWALDLHHTPPIIPVPLGTQNDPRLTLVENQIWISTEGHYGCLVSLKGEDIKRYSFPSWAKKAFLPIPVEKIPLIEKITYCVIPEFILYDVPLAEHPDTLQLKQTTEQVSIRAIPEKTDTLNRQRADIRLDAHIQLEDNSDATRLDQLAEQVRISAILEKQTAVERIRLSTGLAAHLAPVKFNAVTRLNMTEIRIFYTAQLQDKRASVHLERTTEHVRVSALPEKREAVERIRFSSGFSSPIAPVEFKALTRLSRAEIRLFYTAQLHERRHRLRFESTTEKVRVSALSEKRDTVNNMQVGAELSSHMAPVEFKPHTTYLNMDEVPLDMWALDVNVLASPVLRGDPRLREEAGRIMLETTGQRGCLVSYSDGKMNRYEFPLGATEVHLPHDGLHSFHDILKIVFI